MSLIEKARQIFSGKQEIGEQEQLTTAQKVNQLIEILDLQESGVVAREHGPFALVPLFESLVVVDDTSEAFDRWEIDRQVQELKEQEEYKDLHYMRLSPRDFLAYMSTGGMYVGFHDKMGFAIKLGELRSRGWSEDKPNKWMISHVLKKSGFENIEESRLTRD